MPRARIVTRAAAISALLLSANGHADDLLQIYDLATNNDPLIREARAQYNATHTQVAQGRSQLLPSVTLTGQSARNTQATEDAWDYDEGFNSHSWGVNLNQNLLNFEAWYSFQAIREADRQALTNLAINEQDLILRVAGAYFDVLRSLDNLASFEAEEAAAQSVLDQTQQRFDVGLTAITDVYDSQAGYDLARVNRLVEENNLQQRYEALEAITGIQHQDVEVLSEEFPIDVPAPANLMAWVELAEENNLSIQAAEYQLESRRDEARAARAAMYPTLTIQASYNDRAETANPFSFFPNTASRSSGIAVNFSMPLFAGGANAARKRQAYYNRDASGEVLLRTLRDAVRDTRNSYRSVETNVLAVRARDQAIVSAESALEATEVGVEVGTRNVVDLVQAQRTLYQALREHANARYDYVINSLNLKQAAGTLSPQDVIELNQWLEP